MKIAANTSDTDSGDILAFYLFTLRRRRKGRYRCISVHLILQKHHIYGKYHHLVKELHFHPDKFHCYFRVTEEQLHYMLGLIEDDIQKKDANWLKVHVSTPTEQLAICLR